MNLTIMCITRVERFALPFLHDMARVCRETSAHFLLAVDGPPLCGCEDELIFDAPIVTRINVKSKGYLESVHDDVLKRVTTDYVLRLDDDECCSPAMVKWLVAGKYTAADHWKFARAALWGDENTVILNPQLWPDCQTRLSRKHMANGRNIIHAGSPHGGGQEAPCVIEHHSFLVKPLERRREAIKRYDSIALGAGRDFAIFSTPEDVLERMQLGPLHDGTTQNVGSGGYAEVEL